jgi:transglutaminase-like putative cysteine protease
VSIHVALHHVTHYHYDRAIHLGPQVVRLRPCPHSRTRVLSYSLKVAPEPHFINWQQDPQGNYLARLVFPEKTREFRVEVDLVAEMAVINPFDFFLEPHAEKLSVFLCRGRARARAGSPIWRVRPVGRCLMRYVAKVPREPVRSVDFLVALNQCSLQKDIGYTIRMEPGVQTPEETLHNGPARAAIRPGCWCRCCAIWVWRRGSCPAT